MSETPRPLLEIKTLGPSVKAAAETYGLLDDPAEMPVAAREGALKQARLGIVAFSVMPRLFNPFSR